MTNEDTTKLLDELTKDPVRALDFWYTLANRIKVLEFPAAYVKEFDEDIDGETITTLRCGVCHEVLDEESLTAVDWDTRWTTGANIDFADKSFHIEYDGEQNYEGLYYRCASHGGPISLPEGWREY